MKCKNVKICDCPKDTCENYGKCCACVTKHRETDSLPFCLFPDNDGDKSAQNYYKKLKERFGRSDAERLAKFEEAYRDLQISISELPGKLEILRAQGKEKTVTYKEMLTQKLINNNILMFFEKYGLTKE